MRVSISKVKDVEVRVGGVVEGQVGAGGAEGAMLRACIDLRHRTFPRQRQGWRLRSSHTEH